MRQIKHNYVEPIQVLRGVWKGLGLSYFSQSHLGCTLNNLDVWITYNVSLL